MQNEPIRSDYISTHERKTFIDAVAPEISRQLGFLTTIPDDHIIYGGEDPRTQIPYFAITNKPRNYSDDHIYEDDNGVVRTHTDESKLRYPSTVDSLPQRHVNAFLNPIPERGEAQLDLVIPDDGSEPYVYYLDHAYLNVQTLDPNHPNHTGEVSQDWMRDVSAGLVSLRDRAQGGYSHTGAFRNYPDFIKGDERLEFRIPVSELPPEVGNAISDYQKSGKLKQNKKDLGSGSLADTTSISATDAATISGERKRKKKTKPMESYQPNRPKFLQQRGRQPIEEVVTSKQKRILREIKKPFEIKEAPTKFKVKPTGRKNKSVGVDMMKIPDVPNQYKPPAPSIWSAKDRDKNIRASQEKKNEVLELVGAAEHHWTYLTEQKRKAHQEKVNEMMSAEFDKHLELMYENHKIKEERVNKAIKAVKRSSDLAPDYPENPPPQLDPETGMHPKYGKKYKHDKLDPHSAEAMPPTGDPVIDANVKKATDAKRKARKLKVLKGKTKEG